MTPSVCRLIRSFVLKSQGQWDKMAGIYRGATWCYEHGLLCDHPGVEKNIAALVERLGYRYTYVPGAITIMWDRKQ